MGLSENGWTTHGAAQPGWQTTLWLASSRFEHLPHRCRIDLDQFLQPGNIGGETIIDEPAHQVMMDRRFKFTLLDHFRLQFPRKKWKCRSNLSTPLRPCVDAKGHPQTRLPRRCPSVGAVIRRPQSSVALGHPRWIVSMTF